MSTFMNSLGLGVPGGPPVKKKTKKRKKKKAIAKGSSAAIKGGLGPFGGMKGA